MPIREDTPQSITDGMVDQQEDSEIILPLDQKIYFYQMYRPWYTGTEKRIDPIISSNNHINVFTIDPNEVNEFDGNIAEMEVASKLVISNTEEQEQKPIIRRKIVISERCEFLQNGNWAVALFEPIKDESDLDRLWFFDSVSPKYGYAESDPDILNTQENDGYQTSALFGREYQVQDIYLTSKDYFSTENKTSIKLLLGAPIDLTDMELQKITFERNGTHSIYTQIKLLGYDSNAKEKKFYNLYANKQPFLANVKKVGKEVELNNLWKKAISLENITSLLKDIDNNTIYHDLINDNTYIGEMGSLLELPASQGSGIKTVHGHITLADLNLQTISNSDAGFNTSSSGAISRTELPEVGSFQVRSGNVPDEPQVWIHGLQKSGFWYDDVSGHDNYQKYVNGIPDWSGDGKLDTWSNDRYYQQNARNHPYSLDAVYPKKIFEYKFKRTTDDHVIWEGYEDTNFGAQYHTTMYAISLINGGYGKVEFWNANANIQDEYKNARVVKANLRASVSVNGTSKTYDLKMKWDDLPTNSTTATYPTSDYWVPKKPMIFLGLTGTLYIEGTFKRRSQAYGWLALAKAWDGKVWTRENKGIAFQQTYTGTITTNASIERRDQDEDNSIILSLNWDGGSGDGGTGTDYDIEIEVNGTHDNMRLWNMLIRKISFTKLYVTGFTGATYSDTGIPTNYAGIVKEKFTNTNYSPIDVITNIEKDYLLRYPDDKDTLQWENYKKLSTMLSAIILSDSSIAGGLTEQCQILLPWYVSLPDKKPKNDTSNFVNVANWVDRENFETTDSDQAYPIYMNGSGKPVSETAADKNPITGSSTAYIIETQSKNGTDISNLPIYGIARSKYFTISYNNDRTEYPNNNWIVKPIHDSIATTPTITTDDQEITFSFMPSDKELKEADFTEIPRDWSLNENYTNYLWNILLPNTDYKTANGTDNFKFNYQESLTGRFTVIGEITKTIYRNNIIGNIKNDIPVDLTLTNTSNDNDSSAWPYELIFNGTFGSETDLTLLFNGYDDEGVKYEKTIRIPNINIFNDTDDQVCETTLVM